jgi:hypothetical protein
LGLADTQDFEFYSFKAVHNRFAQLFEAKYRPIFLIGFFPSYILGEGPNGVSRFVRPSLLAMTFFPSFLHPLMNG